MSAKCAKKVRWDSEALADGHRLLLLHHPPSAKFKQPDPTRLHVYRCPDCGGWHVGHSNRRLRGMEEIARRQPVNRTAALVTQAGPKYVALSKRIAQTHSAVPLPTVPVPLALTDDMRGRTFGHLTVIGLAEPTDTRQKQCGKHRLWVCRCVCGSYLTRRGKSIKNPLNTEDACDHCRHLRFLQERQRRIESGEYVPERSGLTATREAQS